MFLKEHNISVRLPQEKTIDTGIVFVQNDKDVYKLNIRVFDGVYEIDYTEVEEATITFSKADGTVVQGDMQIEADQLTYVLGTNEIAAPGKLIATIQLLGAKERLTTARFAFQVEKDLITEKAVKSTSEFPILQRLVKDVEDTLPLLPEIEETIEKFPQIQGFFNTAQAAENQRISNEITRQSQEDVRQSQESVRQAKIIEIEERFQRLTSQQQHDAEVIDARDGETSLRARLDRDKADIENRIDNPEYSSEQVVTGGIGNLPENLVEGQINDIIINGRTATNDGTKTVLASLQIKTYGKNLFDLKNPSLLNDTTIDGSIITTNFNSSTFKFSKKIKLKPNTQYTAILFSNDISCFLRIFDGQGTDITINQLASVPLNGSYPNGYKLDFTTRENGEALITTVGYSARYGTFNYRIMVVEKDAEVTTFEEYKESLQYISAKDSQGNLIELRSLPNGVKDAINTQKYKLIKRVSNEVIINGSSGFSQGWFSDSIEGIYLCPILNWATNNNAAQNGRNDVIATSSDGNYQNYGDYELNKKCIYFKNGHLYLGIEKSKVDAMSGSSTYEKFINYLNQYPITLIYQLASPVEIPVTIDGVLQAFEDGSIYIEPYLKEEFSITGTSINLPIPISAIDKIEILQNNVWTEATGTLSSDGKTITVSTSGKYRVFGSIKSEESLIPEVTYTVPVNLKAQVDSNTKAITAMSKSIIDLNDKVDILLILNS